MTVRDVDTGVSPRHVFGSMLRFYRTRAGLSQEQVGALIHFSADQVGKVENGLRTPTQEFTAEAWDTFIEHIKHGWPGHPA